MMNFCGLTIDDTSIDSVSNQIMKNQDMTDLHLLAAFSASIYRHS